MGDISKNFSRYEFACKCGCGFDTVDAELLEVIQDLRDHYNKSITITSGCRCFTHNKNEGGSDNSQHLQAKAVDFMIDSTPADEVNEYLEEKYPDKYGVGRYHNRNHLDVRSTRVRYVK